jgi:hypothetical protein
MSFIFRIKGEMEHDCRQYLLDLKASKNEQINCLFSAFPYFLPAKHRSVDISLNVTLNKRTVFT